MLVQRVTRTALEPIASHHEGVHEQVPVAEGDEVLRHRDALLLAHLLHLEHRARDGDEPELDPVISLPRGTRGGEKIEGRGDEIDDKKSGLRIDRADVGVQERENRTTRMRERGRGRAHLHRRAPVRADTRSSALASRARAASSASSVASDLGWTRFQVYVDDMMTRKSATGPAGNSVEGLERPRFPLSPPVSRARRAGTPPLVWDFARGLARPSARSGGLRFAMSGDGKVAMGFGIKKAKKSVVVGASAGGEDEDAPKREYVSGVSGSGLELRIRLRRRPLGRSRCRRTRSRWAPGVGGRHPRSSPTSPRSRRTTCASRPPSASGKGETAQSGDVAYGLTKMGPKPGSALAVASESSRRGGLLHPGRSLAEKELQAFKEDLADLPEQATLDDYESMPIEDFGAAMLRGMGWEEGSPSARTRRGWSLRWVRARGPGAWASARSPPRPSSNPRRVLKPGETRDAPRRMVLADAGRREGKLKNVKPLDEKLVKREAPGPREGKTMRVVEGRHRGVVGRVLGVTKEEGALRPRAVELASAERGGHLRAVLRARGDGRRRRRGRGFGFGGRAVQEARARRGRRRGEAREERRRRRAGRRRRDATREGGVEAEQTRASRARASWVLADIRVRVVSKSFEGGRLYLKKASVADVTAPRECVIELSETGEVLSRVPQRALETALPKRGGRVVVLAGERRGQRGSCWTRRARPRPCSSRRISPCRTSGWTTSRSTRERSTTGARARGSEDPTVFFCISSPAGLLNEIRGKLRPGGVRPSNSLARSHTRQICLFLRSRSSSLGAKLTGSAPAAFSGAPPAPKRTTTSPIGSPGPRDSSSARASCARVGAVRTRRDARDAPRRWGHRRLDSALVRTVG